MTTHNGAPRSDNRAAALLLPGMSLNETIFPELELETIAPDLSGIDLGDNGITPELRRDRFDVYVRIIERAIEDSGCWRDARRIVVGHSFGGMLALHWLSTRRESEIARIDGLVMIATTPGPMYERVRLRLPFPWEPSLRVGASSLLPVWNLEPVTKLVKRISCGGRIDAEPMNFRELGIRSEADLGRAGWRNVDWRALRAYRFTMIGFDVRARLKDLAVPTIILHGTDDSLFETAEAERLASLMPSAEVRLVQGAGHALPVTHGAEVVRAVSDLMGG